MPWPVVRTDLSACVDLSLTLRGVADARIASSSDAGIARPRKRREPDSLSHSRLSKAEPDLLLLVCSGGEAQSEHTEIFAPVARPVQVRFGMEPARRSAPRTWVPRLPRLLGVRAPASLSPACLPTFSALRSRSPRRTPLPSGIPHEMLERQTAALNYYIRKARANCPV
jgi:hypothetical protein